MIATFTTRNTNEDIDINTLSVSEVMADDTISIYTEVDYDTLTYTPVVMNEDDICDMIRILKERLKTIRQ